VPGGDRITAEERTPLTDECAELYRGVAPNTGAWCLSALIRRNKRLQNGIGKLLFKILNMERDAEMIGNATSIISSVKGAAALAVTVALISGAV
jgi:hypothetical protein